MSVVAKVSDMNNATTIGQDENMIPFVLLEEERLARDSLSRWEAGADMPWLPREETLAAEIEASRKARLRTAEEALDAFYARLP